VDSKRQQWLARNAHVILDAVVDAIITMDTKGIVQIVNQAAVDLFGYPAHELEGQPITTLMPEPYRSQHAGYVDSYLASAQAKIIGVGRELVGQRKDDSIFPIYLAVSEVRSAEGVYFVGIIRDLSEHKVAQEMLLKQKDHLAQVGRLSTMGEMTASIAHEINQPLTAISMYAQACIRLIEKGAPKMDTVLEAVRKLNDQSLRAGAIIERVQRFVQNVGGQRDLVDLNTVLLDLRYLAVGDARLHGVELVFDLTQPSPKLLCDPIQIQQVALNLIRNAIDAMFEIDCKYGREIKVVSSVSTKASQKIVEVRVQDCGPGVDEENAAKLFTAFHTTKRDGMGMGLSICRSIVEEHGGELNFCNNAENDKNNHGASFYFRIPLGAEHE